MKRLLFLCVPLFAMEKKETPKVEEEKHADVRPLFRQDAKHNVLVINDKIMRCDVCGMPAVSFYVDSEVGAVSCRCAAHK